MRPISVLHFFNEYFNECLEISQSQVLGLRGQRLGWPGGLAGTGCENPCGTQPFMLWRSGRTTRMCFGDGGQYTTGCTLSKDNIRKVLSGKPFNTKANGFLKLWFLRSALFAVS